MKWIVAALVVSVLVNLFSRLRKQGDHSHSSVVAQARDIWLEGWQRLIRHAPSNGHILLVLLKMIGRRRVFKALPTSVRSVLGFLLSQPACMLILVCAIRHHDGSASFG